MAYVALNLLVLFAAFVRDYNAAQALLPQSYLVIHIEGTPCGMIHHRPGRIRAAAHFLGRRAELSLR
jgi:hypothetical protein